MKHAVITPDLQADLEKIETISDKIRLLDSKGISRADIARILKRRYQHVRNVLEQDAAKLRSQVAREVEADPHSNTVEIAADGMLRLNALQMEAIGLPQGGKAVVVPKDGALEIVSVSEGLRRVQAIMAQYDFKGDGIVDDLIADRRAEVARE